MQETQPRLLTLEQVQEQFAGRAPKAIVDAYRMLGEAEAEGKAVFDDPNLSNEGKLARLAKLEREWVEAAQLIFFWSNFSDTAQHEN